MAERAGRQAGSGYGEEVTEANGFSVRKHLQVREPSKKHDTLHQGRSADRLEELKALGVEPAVLDLERPAESPVWDGRYAAAVYAVAPGPGDHELAFRHGPLECARRLLAAPAPPRFPSYREGLEDLLRR